MPCRPYCLVTKNLTLLFVTLSFCASLSGCGGSGAVPVYPVTGKVFYKGEPAEGALVVFYPVGHEKVSKEKVEPRPSGMVDGDGTFKLTTHENNDGARAGDYQISVVWFKGNVFEDQEPTFGGPGKEGTAGTKDVLNRKYAEPAKSGLKASVIAGRNELDPIELE